MYKRHTLPDRQQPEIIKREFHTLLLSLGRRLKGVRLGTHSAILSIPLQVSQHWLDPQHLPCTLDVVHLFRCLSAHIPSQTFGTPHSAIHPALPPSLFLALDCIS